MPIIKNNDDCEIVTAEFEGCTNQFRVDEICKEFFFRVDEICKEFFGSERVSDDLIQEYADILAVNLEVVKDFDGEIATLDESNFNDSFHDMMLDLRERHIQKLQKREKALYAIALECFHELCAGMPSETIKKRLDGAIENTIKEQQT